MNIAKELRAERLIAKRYEELGYTVTLEPPSSAIPFPLGSYRPDILAIRGTENLIIEVKTAGARVDPEIYFRLDEQVQQHPGWRFLLVTVNGAELDEPTSGTAENLSVESIRKRLKSVARLGDDIEIATLVLPALWTAYVASLRLLLVNEGIEGQGYSDLSLLNKAYSAGLISFDEHEAGRRLMALRNQAVHSLDTLSTTAECMQLRQMIEEILNRLSPTLPATTIQ
jgi:hypothetical protein